MAFFSWYDYLFFFMMLCSSALIGIYFGCFAIKQSSKNEYLMGNNKMKVVPIAVSLVASHVSGITLLAIPADVYRYGAGYFFSIVGLIIITPLTIYIYLPVFFKIQVTSTYEYLERRFDNKCRMFASFLFALGLLLYLPIVIYIPALAFSAATNINVHYVTPLICGVCIFYTTLGGLRAVVWTDFLQYLITMGAIITVVIIGVKSGGGFEEIWTRSLEGQRLNVFNFNPDPTERDSFWVMAFGYSFFWLSFLGVHQTSVQKFLSVSSLRKAQLSVVFYVIGVATSSMFSVFMGLLMYSKYANCDPFTIGLVQKNDQLLPYYIMDVASKIPLLSGVFISGVVCASLSVLSADLNCLAGSIYEDFIVKTFRHVPDERKTTRLLRLIVLISGIICTALVYVVEHLGGIVPIAQSLASMTFGPLLGMFTLGILFSKASSKGAFYGAIIGLLFSSWLVIMVQYYKGNGMLPDKFKPTSIADCFNNTIADTSFNYNTSFSSHLPMRSTNREQPFVLFRISFYYFCPIGTIVTIVVGLLISYMVKSDDPPVHHNLLSPLIYRSFKNKKIQDYRSGKEALHLVSVPPERDDEGINT